MNNRLTILYFSDIHIGDGKPENQDLVIDEFVKDCEKQWVTRDRYRCHEAA